MNRSRLTTLKQRGIARWNNRVLVPIPPYSSGGGAQGLEDLHQGNRNVTTDMEKAEVLVESDENTQGVWTYLQRRLVLVKREKHCSL